MTSAFLAYGYLAFAIICEVTGTFFLQRSAQFTRPLPTLAMAILYTAAFFFLAQALRGMPLGVAYAIWAGLGIVLTAVVGWAVFHQALDAAAMVGIAMIVGGVVVMQAFSQAATH
ncbi:multidrug efflux SMR transporter [Jiella endophytica]|uniref:Multidrug efflux SMR transporter n=1 Tax=Jiella endophytica TaxID=2558362 RepID=A0A4Y8RH68_9HYPH|nr:multidrug efflux SMR transporter [Jiella endophytica]TFF22103.1 multidrug efflux SMR transporter [Jiella endophytica]